MNVISGESGKGGSIAQPIHVPNTIRSRAELKLLYAITAGPVEGLAKGKASLTLDGVPVGAETGDDVNIGGVNWRFVEGGDDAEPHDGFNAVETVQSVGHQLLKDLPHTRVSPHAEAGEGYQAKLIFRFPQGLAEATERGVFGAEVEIKFETRSADGTWEERAIRTVAEKQNGAFEMQIAVAFHGDYKTVRPAVRVTRLNDVSVQAEVRDAVVWKAVSWIKADHLSYDGIATLAVTYDAEAFGHRLPQLALEIKGRQVRVPQNYNPETRLYRGVWDGAFKLAYSNNPAWVLYDLLTDASWGLGLEARLIEVFDLYDIAKYNDGMVSDGQGGVEPRFLFDAVLARRMAAMDLVRQICSGMNVIMFWSAGRLRFVQDKPQEPIMWITNDHVIDGVFSYAGTGQREHYSHALVSFHDPARAGGIAVEAEMRRDVLAKQGYSAKEVALLGCKRRSQAKRHARWLLEKADDSLFAVSWRAGLDYFADNPIRPGDVIKISDRMNGSFGAVGRIRLGDAIEGVRPVLMRHEHKAGAALAEYEAEDGSLQKAVAVGVSHGGNVNSGLGQEREITITPTAGDWPKLPLEDGVMILTSGTRRGESGFDFRVTAVREVADFQVEIEAVRHDNASFTRIETGLDIPQDASQDLPDFKAVLPVASGLTLNQPQEVDGQEKLRDVMASWQAPVEGRVASWLVKAIGPSGESVEEKVTTSPAVLRDLSLGTWTVTVQAVDWLGRQGEAVEQKITVQKDPITPKPPKTPVLTAGYGQLNLSWDRQGMPHDAVVEVMALTSPQASRTSLVHVVSGSTVSIASDVGVMRHFKLRTKLKGGSVSGLSAVLSGAARAAPKGEDGARGSVIAEGVVTAARWSDQAADDVIEGEGLVAGDIVTLKKTTTPIWAETRRYDGEAWVKANPIFTGDAIVEKTLPASRLKIDDAVLGMSEGDDKLTINTVPAGLITTGVLQSSNYVKDEAGFSIDTAGAAELNNARIRGVLDSAEIMSSVMVAAQRVIPAEDQTQFYTLENERPITYQRRTIAGQRLDLGPMMINGIVSGRRFGDGRKIVLSANNPKGAAAGKVNREFTRFWSKTPLIKAVFTYEAIGTPWGDDITHGKIRVTLKTAGGQGAGSRVLATSPLFRLNQNRGPRMTYVDDPIWKRRNVDHVKRILLPYTAGFHLNSGIVAVRKVAVHPANGQSYTERLVVTVLAGAEFLHDANQDDGDTGLMLSCDLDFTEDFTTAAGQPSKVLNSFYFSSEIDATTHS